MIRDFDLRVWCLMVPFSEMGRNRSKGQNKGQKGQNNPRWDALSHYQNEKKFKR